MAHFSTKTIQLAPSLENKEHSFVLKSCICWFSRKLMDGMDEYESAFRSNEHYICSSENKA